MLPYAFFYKNYYKNLTVSANHAEIIIHYLNF